MLETGSRSQCLAPWRRQATCRDPLRSRRRIGHESGFTAIELLFSLAVMTALTTMAVPMTRDAVDQIRTSTAARYLAARLNDARMSAVKRSTCIALRFEADAVDYRFTAYMDGNGNGVRSTDIAASIDTPLGASEKLRDKFPDVRLGLLEGYPDVDDVGGTGGDGVRIGTPRIATMSPDGTATPGTLYVHGRRSQFAIRILGTTGRVRLLRYRPGAGWGAL